MHYLPLGYERVLLKFAERSEIMWRAKGSAQFWLRIAATIVVADLFFLAFIDQAVALPVAPSEPDLDESALADPAAIESAPGARMAVFGENHTAESGGDVNQRVIQAKADRSSVHPLRGSRQQLTVWLV